MRTAIIFKEAHGVFTGVGSTNKKTVLINKIKELAADLSIAQIHIELEQPKSEE